MKMRVHVVVLLFALLVTSCNRTIGSPYSEADVSTVVDGVTTIDEVKARFGKPFVQGSDSDGGTHLSYGFSQTHINGASFIPIVGIFAGGVDGKMRTINFVFDRSGLLKSHVTSESNNHL